VYLRARYYSPALGVFPSRDPFEGVAERAMSLNGYSWVEGNVTSGAVDSPLSQPLDTVRNCRYARLQSNMK
ncbi:MAG: hypothetical protein JNJ78_24980, partial [Anaerolineae bacterium]|nr:hypothetical protein [Anaerolineae bacterium]